MDADLKEYLEAMEGRLNERFNKFKGLTSSLEGRPVGLENCLKRLENRLVQEMDALQTELLRVFAAASEDQTIQLRKM